MIYPKTLDMDNYWYKVDIWWLGVPQYQITTILAQFASLIKKELIKIICGFKVAGHISHRGISLHIVYEFTEWLWELERKA